MCWGCSTLWSLALIPQPYLVHHIASHLGREVSCVLRLSQQGERRQLAALRLPNVQVPWLIECEIDGEPSNFDWLDWTHRGFTRLCTDLHWFTELHCETTWHQETFFHIIQVASAESCEAMAVQPGRWYDVPGLTQISYTDNGEKA